MNKRLAVALSFGALAAGCAAVLGFEDTSVRPDAADASVLDATTSDADASPSALSYSPSPVVVRRGGSTNVALSLQRGSEITGAVTVTLEDLPAGVSAPPVAIDPSSASATLVVSATSGATLGSLVAHLHTDSALLPTLDVPISIADPAGSLDVTFDSDGLVSDSSRGLSGTFYGVALQADAKIVAGGVGGSPAGWMVRRLLPSGIPDAAFTTATTVGPDAGVALPSDGELRAVAIDPSGRILLAGSSSPGMAQPPQLTVVRLQSTGVIDATFAGGIFRLPASEAALGSIAYALGVQPDGTIVVAGARRDTLGLDGGPPELAGIALRLKSNGTRDTAFGGGVVAVKQNKFIGVSVQADGSIVLAGTDSNTSRTLPSYFLTRRTSAGQLDTSFGVGGTLDFGQGFRANAFARLPDGTFGVVGDSTLVGDPRYTAGLSAQAGAQLWIRGVSRAGAAYFAAASATDGRLVATGHTADEARVDMILADGGLDDSFSDGGTAFVEPPGASPFTVTLFGAAVQADGRLVVVGNRSNAGAVVYRLWP